MDEGRQRSPGRGAYLCRDASCWERALRGPLARALRTALTETDREALAAHGDRFTGASGDDETDEEHTHCASGERDSDERDE